MGSPAPLRPTVAQDDDPRAPASYDALTALSASGETRWLRESYELHGELGHGGMSTVYLATERATGRSVAVKVLTRQDELDLDTESHFECEARSAALLRHPNIVETLAVGSHAGSVVAIVNAYVRGESLRALLERSGPLPFDHATRILRDVAAALAHAHRARIVHCDVKPANILIEAETGRALLTDFGIACDLDANARRTTPGLTVGTPAYMSPEQIAGTDIDESADVYALGVVAWEMLTGAAPWQGESLSSVLFKQQYELLPDLAVIRPDIPAFLLRAINTALSKNRLRRQSDAAAFLMQLDPTPVPVEVLASGDPDEVEDPTAGETVRFVPPSLAHADATAASVNVAPLAAEPSFMPAEFLASFPASEPAAIPRIASVPARRIRVPRPPIGRLVEVVIALWCVLALGALGMSVFAPDTIMPLVDHAIGRAVPVDTALDSMLTQAVTQRIEHPAGRAGSAACRSASARKTAACRATAHERRSGASAHRTNRIAVRAR